MAPVLTILRGNRERADAISERIFLIEDQLYGQLNELVEMEMQFCRNDLRCTSGPRKGKPLSPRSRSAWLKKFVRLARSTGPLIDERIRLHAELKALGVRRTGIRHPYLRYGNPFDLATEDTQPEGAA